MRTTYHTAFPAPIGGGAYDRAAGLAPATAERPLLPFPHPIHPTLQAAIDALDDPGGIVEITTNDVFDAPTAIDARKARCVRCASRPGPRNSYATIRTYC